jgi:hypothetical protein
MPEYFAVLNARYGMEGLIAESHRILDLAFLAANYRYTQLVGSAYYRMGLSTWPPPEDWSSGFLSSASALASSQVALDLAFPDGRKHGRDEGAASSALQSADASASVQAISAVRSADLIVQHHAERDAGATIPELSDVHEKCSVDLL